MAPRTPTAARPVRGPVPPTRVTAIRSGGVRSAIGPATALPYVVATWGDAPHRPALLALVGMMLLVSGLTWWSAPRLARSAARVPVQVTISVLNLGASAWAGVLDGGVMSPLGAWVLFSLLFLSIMTPPRAFAFLSAVSLAGYGWLAWSGGTGGRPGYVAVHVLGSIAIAGLCFRHATALASLRRRLAEVSRVDPLTGCLNRRGFEDRLDGALAHAAQRGTPVTLVLVDLDRFKEVNDTYGHRAGDGLLAWTAHALGRHLGPRDAVGRLGGDEFAVLLSGTPHADAGDATERLRGEVTGTTPSSFGFATFPDDAGTAEELRHVADVRLYADKVGRERVLPAPEAVERATADVAVRRPARVSRRERRRRSLTAIGWLALVDYGIGLLYVALFTGGSAHRGAMALCVGLGSALGLTMIIMADRILGLSSLRTVYLATSSLLVVLGYVATVLDGGLSSPISLGLLLPMPLIALASPPRGAAPVILVLAGLYVSAGILDGTSGGWFITMRLVGAVAAAAACAMQGREAAARRVQLMHLSRVDVLTECLNRRGFDEQFEAELGRCDADGLSLLILDLDGFKTLNDTRGHAAGDELLRWVGATLRQELRSADVVGRLGGDEFVAVLPRSSHDAARATAQRLVTALAARTPVSVGLASMPEHGTDFRTLYHHADEELYAEKARRGSRRGAAAAVVPPSQAAPGRAAAVTSPACP